MLHVRHLHHLARHTAPSFARASRPLLALTLAVSLALPQVRVQSAGVRAPVAVVTGPDGALYVLDAGRKRIVHYAGLGQDGFQALLVSGVPLALVTDGDGLAVSTCDAWSGAGAVRGATGDRALATPTPTSSAVVAGTPPSTPGASTPGTATVTATATATPQVMDTPAPRGTPGQTETPLSAASATVAATATMTSIPGGTDGRAPRPTAPTS